MDGQVDGELLVAAPQVLYEGVAGRDGARGSRLFESAHRTEWRFEPAVVGFDPVVRVLLGVVKRAWHELIDGREEGPGPVGDDLGRLAMGAKRACEEPPRSLGVASGRDVDVDDLAVLVDGPVDVAPPARDLHIGLVHVPMVTDHVAKRSGSIDEERREALDPPVHGDVVDLDATLAQELFDVAVGQPET